MSSAGFGSNEDRQRIEKIERQREERRKKFEAMRGEASAKVEGAGVREFGSSAVETLENAFKNETVGLVTRDEFIQKRATIEQRMEEEQAKRKRAVEQAELQRKLQRKKEKQQQASRAKLSFLGGEDEEEEEEDEEEEEEEEEQQQQEDKTRASAARGGQAEANGGSPTGEESHGGGRRTFSNFGKDPTVTTTFLPDKDREMKEEMLREQLKKEWLAQQEVIKNEPLEITYSYWDGQGHRRKTVARKGDSIGAFLKAVQKQLAVEFRELRHCSYDNLMYIKEDLIIPHNYTFYELIINEARGKTGPLFSFDVKLDIRNVHDASRELDESHAGKIVERHWYDRNKHIFPASRWETYDPEKDYGEYKIRG